MASSMELDEAEKELQQLERHFDGHFSQFIFTNFFLLLWPFFEQMMMTHPSTVIELICHTIL